jgi:hypothetical protein
MFRHFYRMSRDMFIVILRGVKDYDPYFLSGAAVMHVNRTNRLRVDSMADAISFAVDSNKQIQELLKKAKGALSNLVSLVFPKLEQKKNLEELVNAFYVDTDGTIEVPKSTSRLYGELLAFHILMGHGFEANVD